jgi:maltose-binding protein MalE
MTPPESTPRCRMSQLPSPRMARLTLRLAVLACALLVAVAGCSSKPDTELINESVQQSMQQELDTNPDFSTYDLHVVKVVVIKASGNQYEGLATVRTKSGAEHAVSVDVTTDGEQIMWKTEPGAFVFAAQDEFSGVSP